MDIALLNRRITIRKAAVTVDAVGNHTNGWKDLRPCCAVSILVERDEVFTRATFFGIYERHFAIVALTVESSNLKLEILFKKNFLDSGKAICKRIFHFICLPSKLTRIELVKQFKRALFKSGA